MRNYVELIESNPKEFYNKVVLLIIADGYERLHHEFLSEMCKDHTNLFDQALIDEEYFTNNDRIVGELKDINLLLNGFK